jgi:hypothetical protein
MDLRYCVMKPRFPAAGLGSAFNRVTDDATVARIQLPAKRCLMNHLGSQSD